MPPTVACYHPHGVFTQGYILNGGLNEELPRVVGLLARECCISLSIFCDAIASGLGMRFDAAGGVDVSLALMSSQCGRSRYLALLFSSLPFLEAVSGGVAGVVEADVDVVMW